MEYEVRHWIGFPATCTRENNLCTTWENDSHVETIKCGVPQGSVLGPLLFIIYTNDLPGCLNLTKSILFADDTTIYLSSNNISYLYTTMNGELLKLTDWFRANKLSLNISKTNYILFTYQNRQVVTNIDLQLFRHINRKNKIYKIPRNIYRRKVEMG